MYTRFLFSVGFLFLFLHNLDRRALSRLFDVDVGLVTFASLLSPPPAFNFDAALLVVSLQLFQWVLKLQLQIIDQYPESQHQQTHL